MDFRFQTLPTPSSTRASPVLNFSARLAVRARISAHRPFDTGDIASGLFLAFLGREKKNIPIALGIILYLVYLLKIGGDFMSGRFLAAPFLCSLIILARFELSNLPRLLTWILFATVVAIGLLSATPTVNFFELELTPEQRNAMVINQNRQ